MFAVVIDFTLNGTYHSQNLHTLLLTIDLLIIVKQIGFYVSTYDLVNNSDNSLPN